jgi:hypothetical protein
MALNLRQRVSLEQRLKEFHAQPHSSRLGHAMSLYFQTSIKSERPPLAWISLAARQTLVGLILALVACAFAYVGGWFSPNALTPSRLIDAFEQVDGDHLRGLGIQFSLSSGKFWRTAMVNLPAFPVRVVHHGIRISQSSPAMRTKKLAGGVGPEPIHLSLQSVTQGKS